MVNSSKKNYKIKINGMNNYGLGYTTNSKSLTQLDYFLTPFALPNEVVNINIDNKINKKFYCSISSFVKTSNERVKSECQHYTKCGNCLLQHWNYENYISWKFDLIKRPIEKISSNTKVFKMLIATKFSRRRAKFFTTALNGQNYVGFKKYRSNKIFNIKECLILDSDILEFIKIFKYQINKSNFLIKNIVIHVNKLDDGLDILIKYEELSIKVLLSQIFYSDLNINISRVNLQYKNYRPDLILSINTNKLTINKDVYSLIPPGGFFQPTRFAEKELLKNIYKEINNKKNKILDLFSGSGTFSLPLAKKNQNVFSVDINDAAIKSLIHASKQQNLFNNIQCSVENLMKNELDVIFLNSFDLIIIDPPRSGAFLQISKIAALKIKKIISISCNIQTFLRDTKILLSKGYELLYVKPIDQFLYTSHMEIFSVFKYKTNQ